MRALIKLPRAELAVARLRQQPLAVDLPKDHRPREPLAAAGIDPGPEVGAAVLLDAQDAPGLHALPGQVLLVDGRHEGRLVTAPRGLGAPPERLLDGRHCGAGVERRRSGGRLRLSWRSDGRCRAINGRSRRAGADRQSQRDGSPRRPPPVLPMHPRGSC
ncbi:MAG: hypothetical protein HYU88_03250 [Chloroflexi bacterium]|nr:hypothetical protein [Chloroflexota bacterium]